MATRLLGPVSIELDIDAEGYRTYNVDYKVEASSVSVGPKEVALTAGLPAYGSPWIYGAESDFYVWCRSDTKVRAFDQQDDEPHRFWLVSKTFSNKISDSSSSGDSKRCNENEIEDPLLEPYEISGDFITTKEEATLDRFGRAIMNSAFERLRGNIVEFDKSMPQIKIKQNVPLLQLGLLSEMADTLNDVELWGLPARTIKFKPGSWERKFYGQCYVYYTRTLVFDINIRLDPDTLIPESGWDREALDEGTKVLRGDWDRDPDSVTFSDWVPAVDVRADNPNHFIRFKDWNGENARVILNGAGVPIDTGIGTSTISPTVAGKITIQKYRSANLLLLGIPTTF